MDDRILVAAAQWGSEQAQQTTHEQIYETIVKWDEGGGKRSRRELARRIEALLAQQTTEPLGFQIRRAIAAEDELRATKQTLEHAYAALQKVADAQAAIEEPELPEAVAELDFYCDENGPSLTFAPKHYALLPNGVSKLFTAAQMHDHFHAGVRVGMAQSQALQRGLGKVLADPEKHGLDLGDKQ